jgi:hypothetical protein
MVSDLDTPGNWQNWQFAHEKIFARDYPYFGKSDTGTPAGGTKGDTSTPIETSWLVAGVRLGLQTSQISF